MGEEGTKPKYPKPKILLIDVPRKWTTSLRSAGYNAVRGSFGQAYNVSAEDKLWAIEHERLRLPNCEEQEIVIATTRRVVSRPSTHDHVGRRYGVEGMWQSANMAALR